MTKTKKQPTANSRVMKQLASIIDKQEHLSDMMAVARRTLVNQIPIKRFTRERAALSWVFVIKEADKINAVITGKKAGEPTRMALAEMFTDRLIEDVLSGECNHLMTKANRKLMQGKTMQEMEAIVNQMLGPAS
jgi:hypothetical protein